jgi:hypothetical protein
MRQCSSWGSAVSGPGEEGQTLARLALQDLANRQLQECNGTSLEAEIRELLIIAADADLAGLALNPDSSLLPGLCAHLAIVGTHLPARVALDHDNTLTGNVVVLTHSGESGPASRWLSM